MTQVQILDVLILLGKGMNPYVLLPAIGKL